MHIVLHFSWGRNVLRKYNLTDWIERRQTRFKVSTEALSYLNETHMTILLAACLVF